MVAWESAIVGGVEGSDRRCKEGRAIALRLMNAIVGGGTADRGWKRGDDRAGMEEMPIGER